MMAAAGCSIAGKKHSRGCTRLAERVPIETVERWVNCRRALRHKIKKCSLFASRTLAGTIPATARALSITGRGSVFRIRLAYSVSADILDALRPAAVGGALTSRTISEGFLM